MKKCYIYTRVSTEAQIEGYSLDAQQERLRQYADYRELEIANEYCDAGKSGHSIKGRPAFQQMMDDIIEQKDQVSFVLVFKLSRFGRNAADVLKSMQTLMDYDIDLVCVEDAIDSSTQGGRLTMTILSAVAEIERDNINVQFMSGRIQKVMSGGWPGGSAPYGYRNINKQLIVEPEEAEIVKKIFELYQLEDMKATTVVRYLNDNGFKRMSKGEQRAFTYDFVTNILDNPVYCGRIIYGRRTNVKGKKINANDVVGVKGIHEAIISEEQWNEICEKRNKLRVSRSHTNERDHVSILAGLVKCPCCGVGMYSMRNSKINKNNGGYYSDYYSYGCLNYRKANGRTCSFNTTYNQAKLDDAVFEIFCNISATPEYREAVAGKIDNRKSAEELEETLRNIRKQLRQEERKKWKLGEALDNLDVFAEDYDEKYQSIEDKLEAVYDQIEGHETELSLMTKELSAVNKNIEATERTLEVLDNVKHLYGHMTDKEKREMFRVFIDKIDVYPEKSDGRLVKSIAFKIPVYYEERDTSDVPPDDQICFVLDCSKYEKTAAEAKASYSRLKSYIFEKYGIKVSQLYIAQTKRKYGIGMRENYNKPRNPDARVPKCPKAKEEIIVEALKHFRMLDESVEIIA